MKPDKERKCIICSRELGHYKKRFCGGSCYQYYKKKRDKIRYDLIKASYKEIPCSVCQEMFKPIRKNNTACSRACSVIQAKNRQHEKRKHVRKIIPKSKDKPLGRFRIPTKPININQNKDKFKYLKTANFNPSDTTKSAVLEYLKKGNTILKYPDEPRAKIPSVNLKNGWTIEEKIGFGYEYENEQQDIWDDVKESA